MLLRNQVKGYQPAQPADCLSFDVTLNAQCGKGRIQLSWLATASK